MRLKSLKLAGFKSFANVTTFNFPHGITAIVGPNGCGKSNVIDAIRWVLGETSAKQLRGGAMSDVIFAGTQDKAAKSVASVELTFEHTQDEQTGIRHEFNLYHELSVRRQVNLEGRSDYFINGTRARRRDVIDIFLGTGLGARSYAVIEQGMIGRIVDSSPLQLREFVEEAAGVSRYQARREETQKKLEATEDNLARLRDMQSELLRQQKTLSKQAANAQQYKELTQSLADIKQQLATQQLYQAKAAQIKQKQQYEGMNAAVAAQQAEYDALKAKQDKLATAINQEQWLKDDAQSAYHKQQLDYQQADYQLSDIKTQLNQSKQRLEDLAQEQQQALIASAQLKEEQQQKQIELTKLRPQLDDLTAKRAAYKRDEQPLQQAWNDAQNELNHLQERLRMLEQEQALNKQSGQGHKQSYDKWQARQKSWQTLWSQLAHSDSVANKGDELSVAPASSNMTALQDRLQQIERQQVSVDEHLEELQPKVNHLQQALQEQQRKLVELDKQQALLAGEYDTLHQILHPKPIHKVDNHSDKTAKKDAPFDLSLPISTLREQIELSAKGQHYAQALDSVLGLWLDSHVLTDSNNKPDNLAPIEHLAKVLSYQSYSQHRQHHKNGQNNIEPSHSLWLPADDKQTNKAVEKLPHELSAQICPLTDLIAKPTLALWQQCYLYLEADESAADKAQNLATIVKALPQLALLLTLDGWIISRSGMLNLNEFIQAQNPQSDNQNRSQFLTQREQQRTRLAKLEDRLSDIETEIETQQKTIKKTQNDYDALSVSLVEARAQSTQLTRDNYECQQQLNQQKLTYARLQADIKRLDNDKLALEQEEQELSAEQQAIESEAKRLFEAIEALTPKLAAAKSHRQQLQEQRHKLSLSRQIDEDSWQALQLSLQKAEMRLEHHSTHLANTVSGYEKGEHRVEMLETQIGCYEQKLPPLQAAVEQAKLKRDEQQVLLSARETQLTQLKQNYNQQQNELDELQTKLQEQQIRLAEQATELALIEARFSDAKIKAQEALDHYHQMVKASGQEHAAPQNVSVSSLLTDFIVHERRIRPEKSAELERKQSEIERQLTKIGAVNLAAVAELAAVNERLEPLSQQIQDISASMETLAGAIKDIDETTKALFMQTLEAVNIELNTLFAKVFGGGQASLTLNTDEMPADIDVSKYKSEQWRAGLTLMAQPKGKRNSRLAVLSGGEKTLTALSLIFAIFKQHPAPFCVLDEVDAPLDDANVARFTSLILDLTADLQFIFISHNKLSMQIADELKGITMPNAGVSTLVSVSLAEAADYIES